MSKNDLLTRSTEIEAIISRVPGWFVRWGTTLLLLLLAGLLSLSFFISYQRSTTVQVWTTKSSGDSAVTALLHNPEGGLPLTAGQDITITLHLYPQQPLHGKIVHVPDNPEEPARATLEPGQVPLQEGQSGQGRVAQGTGRLIEKIMRW